MGLVQWVMERTSVPKTQRTIVLAIVSTVLLLDYMLYMVIVPIIPDYLRKIHAWKEIRRRGEFYNYTVNGTMVNATRTPADIEYVGEEGVSGLLFAVKAIIQLITNPISGTLIDRYGYELPIIFGIAVMFTSTMTFAFGETFAVLFFARALQGFGSAFADTAGLAMIADRFQEEAERNRALGIALAFISFGFLVAPPFGGILYEFFGKEVPFVCLSMIALVDGILLVFVIRPDQLKRTMPLGGTPIYKLLADPQIMIIAGGLAMANVPLAFLEPTIALWMKDTMNSDTWEIGIVWLPGFLPHVFGVVLCVKLANRFPGTQWVYPIIGIIIIGISTAILPAATAFAVLIVPIGMMCFGIALVDTGLLPALAYLVDARYVAVYGSVYAIADISYSIAYAFGPVFGGSMVNLTGFVGMNLIIAIVCVMYAPVLLLMRKLYREQAQVAEKKLEQAGLLEDPTYTNLSLTTVKALSNGDVTHTGHTSVAPSSRADPRRSSHDENGDIYAGGHPGIASRAYGTLE